MKEIIKQLEELEKQQEELLNKIVELRGSIENILPQRKNDLLECYQTKVCFFKMNLIKYFDINFSYIEDYKVLNNVVWSCGDYTMYKYTTNNLVDFEFVGNFATLIINHSTKSITITEIVY